MFLQSCKEHIWALSFRVVRATCGLLTQRAFMWGAKARWALVCEWFLCGLWTEEVAYNKSHLGSTSPSNLHETLLLNSSELELRKPLGWEVKGIQKTETEHPVAYDTALLHRIVIIGHLLPKDITLRNELRYINKRYLVTSMCAMLIIHGAKSTNFNTIYYMKTLKNVMINDFK